MVDPARIPIFAQNHKRRVWGGRVNGIGFLITYSETSEEFPNALIKKKQLFNAIRMADVTSTTYPMDPDTRLMTWQRTEPITVITSGGSGVRLRIFCRVEDGRKLLFVLVRYCNIIHIS